MSVFQEAYRELFPEKQLPSCIITYSSRLLPYNAYLHKMRSFYTLSMSITWEKAHKPVVLGLIQSLIIRMYRLQVTTPFTRRYDAFLKRLDGAIPKVHADPVLSKTFTKLNKKYFHGFLAKPNLKWGRNTIRTIGRYDFMTDTITISLALKRKHQLLEYVMYHEMLHKFYKFTTRKGRVVVHTPSFRKAERAFPQAERLEKKLTLLAQL